MTETPPDPPAADEPVIPILPATPQPVDMRGDDSAVDEDGNEVDTADDQAAD